MSRLNAILRSRKFRVLAVCLLLTTGGLAWWWFTHNPLEEFVDQDLRKLADTSTSAWRKFAAKYLPEDLVNPRLRLQRILDRILPETHNPSKVGFEPLRVWRLNDDSEPRFLLLLVQRRFQISDEVQVAVYLLHATGKLLADCDFIVSNFTVDDAALRWEKHVDERVLEISVSHLGWPEPSRLIYAIFADRAGLIKVEPGNELHLSLDSFGPVPPHRTAEKCVAQLSSDRPAIVLEALSAMSRFDRGLVLVDDLRYDPSLMEKATELCHSSNPWIRRAAQGALYVINH